MSITYDITFFGINWDDSNKVYLKEIYLKTVDLPSAGEFDQSFIKDTAAPTCRIYNDIPQDTNYHKATFSTKAAYQKAFKVKQFDGHPDGWEYDYEFTGGNTVVHVTAPDTFADLSGIVFVGFEMKREGYGPTGWLSSVTHPSIYSTSTPSFFNGVGTVQVLYSNSLSLTTYVYNEAEQMVTVGVRRDIRTSNIKPYDSTRFLDGFPTTVGFDLRLPQARVELNGVAKNITFPAGAADSQYASFFVGKKAEIASLKVSLVDENGTVGGAVDLADLGAPFIIWDGGLPFLKGSRSKRLKGVVSPPDVIITPKGYPELGYIEAARQPYPRTPIDEIVHLPDRRVSGQTFFYDATDETRLGQTEPFSLQYQRPLVEPNKNAILKHETAGRIEVRVPLGGNRYEVTKDLETLAQDVIVPDIATQVNGGNLMLGVNLETWEWDLYRFNKNKGTTAEVVMAQIWDRTFDAAHLYVLLDGTLLSSAWKFDLAKSTYSLWVRRCIDGIGETWSAPIEIDSFSDIDERDYFQPTWEIKQERTGTVILGDYKSDDMGSTWRR